MRLDFKNNYIKRVSFYAGLIAFFIALGISVFSWFNDTLKEMEILTNDAHSTLASYIKWYQEDSSKELERYSHLSKAEFEKLNVDSIINKNLQDIRVIAENIDTLTRFDFNSDESKLRQVLYLSVKTMSIKMNLFSILLGKEKEFNPKSTYFILNNQRRSQSFSDFQDYLKNRIDRDYLDSGNLDRSSFERVAYYYFTMNAYYFSFLILRLRDIEANICQIDKTIIKHSFSQYHFVQENTNTLFKILQEKIKNLSADEEQNEFFLNWEKFYRDFNALINKEHSTIQTIQTKLKECK